MARAAVPGRLSSRPGPWLVATITATREETPTARSLTVDVPGWPGHLPGQHVAAKLTAADGYSAQRDYSIANAPDGDRVELTVQRLDDGEVSPYLAGDAAPGDQFEIRGPIGGWFLWDPRDTAPLLLLAGGSGIVPLMSIIRTHQQVKSQVPVRLIYSARTPADVIYASELSERTDDSALTVNYLYTRAAPYTAALAAERVPRVHAGRISADVIAEAAFPPADHPEIFVCGPNGFVAAAAGLLVAAGHPPQTIKTESFGPT